MKVIQITAAVENADMGNEDRGTWTRIPNEEATIYGLGDDQRMYVWSCVKSTRVKHDEPDDDGELYHYEREFGWKPFDL